MEWTHVYNSPMKTLQQVIAELPAEERVMAELELTLKDLHPDNRSFIVKLVMFCLYPLQSYACMRFARTGTQEDYWRHIYWAEGSKGIARMMMHKDYLIAHYSERAYACAFKEETKTQS